MGEHHSIPGLEPYSDLASFPAVLDAPVQVDAAAGISYVQRGDGSIEFTIADATAAIADPEDGLTLWFPIRSTLTRKVIDFLPEYNGITCNLLEITTPPANGTGIEVSMGWGDLDLPGGRNVAVGALYSATRAVLAWRKLTGTLTRTVDASPLGDFTKVVGSLGRNVATTGLTCASPAAAGVDDDYSPGSSPWDLANNTGNTYVGDHVFVNIRPTAPITGGDKTIIVKPRYVALRFP